MIGAQGLTWLLAAALLAPLGGGAYRKTEQGNRLFGDGALDEALGAYTDAQELAPDAPQLLYDIGNVLFRQGEFAAAADAYRGVLSETADAGLESAAGHNLGNTLFEQQEFEGAVEAYERALRALPGAEGTKRNLELALRALERQQQQQQQQQGRSDSEEDDSQQDGENQQQPEDQGQQEQPEQGQQQPGDESEGSEQQQEPQPGSASDQETADAQSGEQQATADGLMSREQAERLLDGLAEQELDTLRDEARENAPRGARTSEEDW